MMSTAASLGLSLLRDTEVGLSHIDKYTYSAEEYIKVSGFFQKLCTVKFWFYARLGWCLVRHRDAQHWSSDDFALSRERRI
jgi:hypothetical protein